MKKLIALLLVAVMAMGMVACGAAEEGTPTTTAGAADDTTAAAVGANSALEVLEKVWALYGEDEAFFAMGGDFNAPVDNAPGSVDLTNADFLTYNLLIPAEQQSGLVEAASLIHGMNPNTFTCGAYVVSDVEGFVAAMQTAIQGNQWMCGFPETLYAVNVGGYVVVAFGVNDAITPFQTHLAEAFPNATELVNEPIGD